MKDAVKPMLEKNKLMKKLLFSDDRKSDIIILMITRMVPIFHIICKILPMGLRISGFGNIRF